MNVSVSISMPMELLADVDKASSGLTRSEFVCRALESALSPPVPPASPKDLVGAGSCSGCGRFNGVHAKDCPLHPSNL